MRFPFASGVEFETEVFRFAEADRSDNSLPKGRLSEAKGISCGNKEFRMKHMPRVPPGEFRRKRILSFGERKKKG